MVFVGNIFSNGMLIKPLIAVGKVLISDVAKCETIQDGSLKPEGMTGARDARRYHSSFQIPTVGSSSPSSSSQNLSR